MVARAVPQQAGQALKGHQPPGIVLVTVKLVAVAETIASAAAQVPTVAQEGTIAQEPVLRNVGFARRPKTTSGNAVLLTHQQPSLLELFHESLRHTSTHIFSALVHTRFAMPSHGTCVGLSYFLRSILTRSSPILSPCGSHGYQRPPQAQLGAQMRQLSRMTFVLQRRLQVILC